MVFPSHKKITTFDGSSDQLLKGARILIIDDDESICAILQEFLNCLGLICESTFEPKRAVRLIQQNEYDVILCDVYMPGILGHELLKLSLERQPLTPFILMTGSPTLDNAIEAIRFGAYDYLTKPFNLDFVTVTLKRAIHFRRLAVENKEYQEDLEKKVKERTRELSDFLFHAVQSLSMALEARDPYTQGHANRVSKIVTTVAEKLNVDEKHFLALRLAAQLHDIGKIGIPDAVLQKKGKLTQEEYDLMKDHVYIGYKILSPIPSLQEVSQYIYEHHERYDGNGYPRGLKGDEIDIKSQILMAAEICDALATERCYKKAWSLQKIIEFYKENSGTMFHPDVSAALVEILEEHGEKFFKSLWDNIL